MLSPPAPAGATESGTAWLFTSFRGNGEDGLHLAYSLDGYHWTDLDRTSITPKVGSGLMRDPHIAEGLDGVFHMVWTTGWGNDGIGYASSKDLQNWSDQRFLPFMENIPGTRNCWAPETFYDPDSEQFVITWSSDVEGRFPETVSSDRMNNRTYYVTTRDFETFTDPAVLFDPGFDHIDATLVSFENQYMLVIKEGDKQSLGQHGPIHAAVAHSPLGPFALLPNPIVTARAEGPTLLTLGDKWLLYVDFYSDGRYGVYETTDWKTWRDVSSRASVVPGQRHGTIFPVSREFLQQLAPEADRDPPPAALPGLNADPHIGLFGDTFYIYPTSDGTEGWMSTSFSTWSSKDLLNWKNEGVILDLPRDIAWADVRAWAPAIARRNDKYFFYFSANQSIGVAVGDRPEGPFTDPLGKPLIDRWIYSQTQSIDPMVFIDDDGSAYLYFGQGRCKVVRLNDDMVSFNEDEMRDITPPGYNEGAFLHKRNGVYYLTWSEYDTRDPRYSVAYATSDSPLGPFEKASDNPILKGRGVVKGAGHHSIAQLPGRDEWIIAYHRFRIPDGNGYNRETCLSPLFHDSDGRILPVDVFEGVADH